MRGIVPLNAKLCSSSCCGVFYADGTVISNRQSSTRCDDRVSEAGRITIAYTVDDGRGSESAFLAVVAGRVIASIVNYGVLS